MKNKKNIILIICFILVCIAVTVFFSMFTKSDFFSSTLLEAENISFISDTGDTVEYALPKEEGNGGQMIEDAPRLDGIYVSEYTLKKSEYVELSLSFGAGEAEVFADGNKLYSEQIMGCDYIVSTPDMKIYFNDLKEDVKLVTKIRYTDEKNYIFPAMLSIANPHDKEKNDAAVVNTLALPAGMTGISFVFIIGLFLMSVYFSKVDLSLLFLALANGCYCVNHMISTGAVDINIDSVFVSNILFVLPYAVELFVMIYIIMNRKKSIFRYFWIILSVFCVFVVIMQLLGIAGNNITVFSINTEFLKNLIYSASMDNIVNMTNVYLLLISVAAAFLYYISFISNMVMEKSIIETQSRVLVQGYNNIVNNIRQTAAVRHEWKNDLLMLDVLYKQKRYDEIGDYLEKRNSKLAEFDKVRFTENFMLDVILNSALARADAEGVRLETNINIAESLNIKEEDLCSLLMNMFDNAFNACAMIEGSEKYISFSAVQKKGFVAISCSNRIPQTYREDNEYDMSHGWGLKNMREICRRYGSDLVIINDGEVFTVETALQLDYKMDSEEE